MVFPHRTVPLIYLVILALVLGCSGGGGETPTSPDLPDNGITAEVNHSGAAHNYIWETGEVILDTENLEASVVPSRTIDFTCNIVKFMQPPAGDPSSIQIAFDPDGSDFQNALVDLDLTLNHPFPGTMFWGFDVRVIVFAGASQDGVHDSSVRYPTPTELRMLNADGYTRWWNRDEFGPFDKIFGYTEGRLAPQFTANFGIVNGYKYFCNGISETAVPPNPPEADRGVFSQGSETREMILQFPKVAQPFKFKYSISAGWEAPSQNPPESVDDFSLGANAQEAYQVVVTQDEDASDAFYEEGTGEYGGSLVLEVEVWDWQAGGDPASEISEIWIESPTLLGNHGDEIEITGTWTETATGDNSVKYAGVIDNCMPTSTANQELLVTVVSADPTTYEPPLPDFLYPDSPLAAYQLFTCQIDPYGEPPEKTITVTSPDGGETLVIGESWDITWQHTGVIDTVVIEYSTDSGATYPNVIATDVPAADHSYIWDPIPDTPTTTARVRITESGPTPEAQDESDDDFTISETAEQGWNPAPGQVQIPVEDPAPNQSTATPDFGIQNDGAGAEGAWIVDQEGGIDDGTPYFVDYLLDWSGPGGNEYPSNFNYNFAPFGRHDASPNGIALFGCSANTDPINPPLVNDPVTAMWYISYLMADESAEQGDLYMVTWGDQGTEDPPEDDPDEQPWFHTCDISGGLPDVQGDQLGNAAIWLMCYSHEDGAPPIEQEESGDLNIGFWQYPYLTGGIYRLGFPEYTTDNQPAPLFQAFDVTDASLCRLAADTDSYLTFTENNMAVMTYMLDSLGNWYGTGFEIDFDAGQFNYIGLENSLKIRTDDTDFYVEGATAVDLEMLPTMTYLYEGEFDDHGNWCAVVFDTGGQYVVRIYRVDWTAEQGDEITIIDTTDPIDGTPIALDVDYVNFTIHVLADNGGTIEATVFDYTE